jgi:hypothetical protein
MCADPTLYGVKERPRSQETADRNVNPSCGRLLPLIEESPTGSLPSRRPSPTVALTLTLLPAQAAAQFWWSPCIDEGHVEGVSHPGGVYGGQVVPPLRRVMVILVHLLQLWQSVLHTNP